MLDSAFRCCCVSSCNCSRPPACQPCHQLVGQGWVTTHQDRSAINENPKLITGKGQRAPCAGGKNQTSSIPKRRLLDRGLGMLQPLLHIACSRIKGGRRAVPDPPKSDSIEEAPVERPRRARNARRRDDG